MLFSIIIPTYNRERFLSATINSVLNQLYQNFELIIVDDGSTDDTENVIKSFISDKIHYYKINNSERGAARNYGIKKAKGDYISFLDSDDLYFENYLKEAFDKIIYYKRPPLYHQAYEVKNAQGKVLRTINFLENDDKKFLIKGNPLSCMGVFIRKDVLLEYNFCETRELSGSEDWELWLRIVANYGIKVSNVITGSLINHDSRSVLNYNESQMLKRKELALDNALKDSITRKVYGPHLKKISSYCDSYIALHLILSKRKLVGLKYFIISILLYPSTIFERRTLAIIKHLFV